MKSYAGVGGEQAEKYKKSYYKIIMYFFFQAKTFHN